MRSRFQIRSDQDISKIECFLINSTGWFIKTFLETGITLYNMQILNKILSMSFKSGEYWMQQFIRRSNFCRFLTRISCCDTSLKRLAADWVHSSRYDSFLNLSDKICDYCWETSSLLQIRRIGINCEIGNERFNDTGWYDCPCKIVLRSVGLHYKVVPMPMQCNKQAHLKK